MRLRFALTVSAAVLAVAVPGAHGAPVARVTLAADPPFAAAGTGSARFDARGEALVASAIVRPGTVLFRAGTGPAFVLQCLQPGRPPRSCARALRHLGGSRWQVVRPVRFLYEGRDFSLTVTSAPGFRLLVVGSGRVALRGRGKWSLGGRTDSYDGVAHLQLP